MNANAMAEERGADSTAAGRRKLLLSVLAALLVLHYAYLLNSSYSGRPADALRDADRDRTDAATTGRGSPEIMLAVHYHKTGSVFTAQLSQRINDALHDIGDERDGASRQTNSSWLGTKRTHDAATGCPALPERYEARTLHRVTAPDFFCDLAGEGSRLPAPGAARLVHFVRDPVDMALSSYLYHSQSPTPEKWVKDPRLDPCATDRPMMERVLPVLNVSTNEIDAIEGMCRERFGQNRTFYAALRSLPPYEGLRLAAAQFLISGGKDCGGDLLRMPNNILRLREWTRGGDGGHRGSVRTVPMDSLIRDTGRTVREIVEFVLRGNGGMVDDATFDEFSERISRGMVELYDSKKNESLALAREKLHRGNFSGGKRPRNNAAKLQRLVNDRLERKRTTMNQNLTLNADGRRTLATQGGTGSSLPRLRGHDHVTQGILNETERRGFKARLERDEVLGPVLLRMRAIVEGELRDQDNE